MDLNLRLPEEFQVAPNLSGYVQTPWGCSPRLIPQCSWQIATCAFPLNQPLPSGLKINSIKGLCWHFNHSICNYNHFPTTSREQLSSAYWWWSPGAWATRHGLAPVHLTCHFSTAVLCTPRWLGFVARGTLSGWGFSSSTYLGTQNF